MKNCMLFLMAFVLFTKTYAQNDTTAVVPSSVLLSFQVQPVDKVVLLKWFVEASEEYKSFDIERADDGTNFMKIGSKLAIGKTDDAAYDFVDATPKRNALVRYRLKFISKDGFATYSDYKEAKVVDIQLVARLKQNPVRDRIEIEISNATAKKVTVTVVSNAGQQVISQTFGLDNGRTPLSLFTDGMLPGFYQLIVEAGSDRKVISFIKE